MDITTRTTVTMPVKQFKKSGEGMQVGGPGRWRWCHHRYRSI